MRKCIVNYASRNAWYPEGQNRLKLSLERVGFDGDVLLFDDSLLGCSRHSDTPYGFKPYVLLEAKKRGYDLVLWVDASFWAIQPLSNLFFHIQNYGSALQSCSYPVGMWSSDTSLEQLRMGREEAFSLPMFSGGLIGLNLTIESRIQFLDEFYFYSCDGKSFHGDWKNDSLQVSKDSRVRGHRHDMVVGSILANRLGLTIQPNNTFFSYYAWFEKYKEEKQLQGKIYFVCEGGNRKI